MSLCKPIDAYVAILDFLCADTLSIILYVLLSYFRCNKDYKGARCEQFQLPSKVTDPGEAGLIAAVIIVALLILVVLAVVIYYTHK